MKITSLIIPFLVFLKSVDGQSTIHGVPLDSQYRKWAQAVVYIRVSQSNMKAEQQIEQNFAEKKITFSEFQKLQISLKHNKLYGSGVLIQHNNHFYLVTARHVVLDTTALLPPYIDKSMSSPLTGLHAEVDTTDRRDLPIGSNIAIVENHSFFNKDGFIIHSDSNGNAEVMPELEARHLRLLSAGLPQKRPYVLSSEDEDIAIISLDYDFRTKEFLAEILKLGYKPVKFDDIDFQTNIKTGDKIFSLGFPNESTTDKRQVEKFEAELYPNIGAIPIIANGTVTDLNPEGPYFYSDIFNYHGFSGGAVVMDNKLIGIVSGFDLYRRASKPSLSNYKVYRAYFIKTSILSNYFKLLDEKMLSAYPSDRPSEASHIVPK